MGARDPLVASGSVLLGGRHLARRLLGLPDQVHSHAAEVEWHRVQLRPLDGAPTSSCEGGCRAPWRASVVSVLLVGLTGACRPGAVEPPSVPECRRDLQRPQLYRVGRSQLDGSSTSWIRTRPSGSSWLTAASPGRAGAAWEEYAQCMRAAGFPVTTPAWDPVTNTRIFAYARAGATATHRFCDLGSDDRRDEPGRGREGRRMRGEPPGSRSRPCTQPMRRLTWSRDWCPLLGSAWFGAGTPCVASPTSVAWWARCTGRLEERAWTLEETASRRRWPTCIPTCRTIRVPDWIASSGAPLPA